MGRSLGFSVEDVLNGSLLSECLPWFQGSWSLKCFCRLHWCFCGWFPMEITVCMRNSLSLYNLAHKINVHPLSFMTSWQSVDFSVAVSEHIYLCRYFFVILFFVWYTCKRRPKYNHKMLFVETLIYRVTLHHDFDEHSNRWIRLLFHPCVESFSFNWMTFSSVQFISAFWL